MPIPAGTSFVEFTDIALNPVWVRADLVDSLRVAFSTGTKIGVASDVIEVTEVIADVLAAIDAGRAI